MGADSGSATVPASVAGSPAGSRAPECPNNALREPQTAANPTCRILQPDGQTDALHVTPPLNPAPCTTRAPSMDVETARQWIREKLINKQLLIESEDDNDVPVTVDDADEKAQVDDLA